MASLGCFGCPERDVCGGLKLKFPLFDCLDFCCGTPADCDRVCRNNPDYASRVREVRTFDLTEIPRAPVLSVPVLPAVVPIILHGSGRERAVDSDAVALSLYQMFDRRSGLPRYGDRTALCKEFGVRPDATIILTGVDRDPPLERWWGIGEAKRRSIIRALKDLGVELVTTPNYSLFNDRPRWDDLHAIMRIGIVHAEFLTEGLPAALHVNGRTDADFQRWAEHVGTREEIKHIAYEFTTGTGRAGRRKQHAEWLAGLADSVDRPLHLILRGGLDVLPILRASYGQVTILDTSSFMKTVMRQRAVPAGNDGLAWESSPTQPRAPLHDLLDENLATHGTWLRDLVALELPAKPDVA